MEIVSLKEQTKLFRHARQLVLAWETDRHMEYFFTLAAPAAQAFPWDSAVCEVRSTNDWATQ